MTVSPPQWPIFIDKAAALGTQIALLSIRMAEIVYLIDLKAAIHHADHVFKKVAFTVEIADAIKR